MKLKKQSSESSLEWRHSEKPVPYDLAMGEMEDRVLKIREKGGPELIWFLEHPPLYTAGTSAKAQDLLDPIFPVYKTGRGGQYTYHGPGQRVVYVMLDLKNRNQDLRAYVWSLEEWLIRTLAKVGVTAERREGRIGLWVQEKGGQENKIAAIGVRVQKWITLHGIALNVSPDLDHFKGIVPCGIRNHGVTSLKDLGVDLSLEEVDEILKTEFYKLF